MPRWRSIDQLKLQTSDARQPYTVVNIPFSIRPRSVLCRMDHCDAVWPYSSRAQEEADWIERRVVDGQPSGNARLELESIHILEVWVALLLLVGGSSGESCHDLLEPLDGRRHAGLAR